MSENLENNETTSEVAEDNVSQSAFQFDPELWMDAMYEDRVKDEQSSEPVSEEPSNEEAQEVEEDKQEEEVVAEAPETEQVVNETPVEAVNNESLKQISNDLNISAESYEDLLNQLNTLKSPSYIEEDDTIGGINQVLKLEDGDILKAYKTYVEGYDKEDAEEMITALEESGMIKYEVKKARQYFQNQKLAYIEKLKNDKVSNQTKAQEVKEQYTAQIKDIVSKTDKLFDVVSFKDDQKKEIQDYILTGKFQKDVLANPKALIDFAYFQKYQDTIKNVLKQQGESKGIKSMIETQKPLKSKTSYTVSDKQKGIFDPEKFLSGLYK